MPSFQEIDLDATYAMKPAMRLKGVALGTIRAALTSGRLPATRPGFRWAITGADLLAWQPRRRPAPPGWLTVPDAADATGLARTTLRNAIYRGRLPARQQNGQWQIAPADLAAWRQSMAPVAGPIDPNSRYRLSDAAKLIGVTNQAIHQAVMRGRLPAVATPEGKRIAGADLRAWREQRGR